MNLDASIERPSRWPGLVAVVGLHVALGYAVVHWRKPTVPAPVPPVVATIVDETPPPPPPRVVVAAPPPDLPPQAVPSPAPPPPAAPAPQAAPPPVPTAPPVPVAAPEPAPAPAITAAPAPAAPAPSPVPSPPAAPTAPPSGAVAVVCPNYQRALGDAAFPYEATRYGLDDGEATIEFTVGPRGETKNVRVVKASHPVFGRAGMRVVSDYRCVGQGQDIVVQVPIRFSR